MSDALKPDDELPRSPHHVLDELKSVLSNLGQRTEPAPSDEPVIETKPMPPSSSSSAPASSPASDADFWSGNVLGWPSGADAAKKEPAPEPIQVAPPAPSPSLPPQPPPQQPSVIAIPKDRPPWPVDEILPEPPTAPSSPEKLNITDTPAAFVGAETSVMGEPEPGRVVTPPPFPVPRIVEEVKPAPTAPDVGGDCVVPG